MNKLARSHYWNACRNLGRRIAADIAAHQTDKLPCALKPSDISYVAAIMQAACLFDYDAFMARHGYAPNNHEWEISLRYSLVTYADKLAPHIKLAI